MTRTRIITVALACGLCASTLPATAQDAPAAPAATVNWFAGTATLDLLGRDTFASSKFDEYRVVPKGVSMPVFTLSGSHDGTDYALACSRLWHRLRTDPNIPNAGLTNRTVFDKRADRSRIFGWKPIFQRNQFLLH